jgi:hypothetical protein
MRLYFLAFSFPISYVFVVYFLMGGALSWAIVATCMSGLELGPVFMASGHFASISLYFLPRTRAGFGGQLWRMVYSARNRAILFITPAQ